MDVRLGKPESGMGHRYMKVLEKHSKELKKALDRLLLEVFFFVLLSIIYFFFRYWVIAILLGLAGLRLILFLFDYLGLRKESSIL